MKRTGSSLALPFGVFGNIEYSAEICRHFFGGVHYDRCRIECTGKVTRPSAETITRRGVGRDRDLLTNSMPGGSRRNDRPCSSRIDRCLQGVLRCEIGLVGSAGRRYSDGMALCPSITPGSIDITNPWSSGLRRCDGYSMRRACNPTEALRRSIG